MTRPRNVFVAAVAVFMAALLYASYDIATRTTFPGSKPQLKERIKDKWVADDSTTHDTVAKSR